MKSSSKHYNFVVAKLLLQFYLFIIRRESEDEDSMLDTSEAGTPTTSQSR